MRRVAARYGARAEVTFLADAAVLTVGDRTASFSRTPVVPPLDQVSGFKRLLAEIDDGAVSAREAATRLVALERRPPVFSRFWQVIGLGDMISSMTALAAGMLVAAAAVRSAGR